MTHPEAGACSLRAPTSAEAEEAAKQLRDTVQWIAHVGVRCSLIEWNKHSGIMLRAANLLLSQRKKVIEECAKTAQSHLEDWASDLAFTREQYLDAVTGGKFNGCNINADQARRFAKQFGERSEAVHEAANHTAKAIRSLQEREKK